MTESAFSLFGTASLLVAILGFMAVVAWLVTMDRQKIDHAANLPLEDGSIASEDNDD